MVADNTPSPLEKFVDRATQLYTLPAVAMQVLQLTECPKVDSAALKDCIERDPALVSKILRTVNSSLFGGIRNVTDLNQAIALLGIKPLKLLVLGFSLPDNLLSGIENEALADYWKYTLVKALAARELAARYDGVDPDDAFLAGLLQDIGMLTLLQELGEPYAEFLHQARDEQAELVMLELETLGFDHRLLSARMLQTWGIPEALWRPIAASTSADAANSSPTGLQQTASVLATADGVAKLIVRRQAEALSDVMDLEDENDVTWWSHFAGRLQEQVEQMSEVFDVSIANQSQFETIVRDAYGQLSGEAETAAAQLAAREGGEISAVQGTMSGVEIPSPALEDAVAAFGDAAMEVFDHTDAAQVAASESASATTAVRGDETEVELLRQVSAAVTSCRRRRQPLSLMLLSIDDYEDLIFELGAPAATNLPQLLTSAFSRHLEPHERIVRCGDAELALILGGCDRSSAVDMARRILDESQAGKLRNYADKSPAVTLSIGISTVTLPAKNFPAADLHEAARRCLFAVQSSGGQGVKSIDIY